MEDDLAACQAYLRLSRSLDNPKLTEWPGFRAPASAITLLLADDAEAQLAAAPHTRLSRHLAQLRAVLPWSATDNMRLLANEQSLMLNLRYWSFLPDKEYTEIVDVDAHLREGESRIKRIWRHPYLFKEMPTLFTEQQGSITREQLIKFILHGGRMQFGHYTPAAPVTSKDYIVDLSQRLRRFMKTAPPTLDLVPTKVVQALKELMPSLVLREITISGIAGGRSVSTRGDLERLFIYLIFWSTPQPLFETSALTAGGFFLLVCVLVMEVCVCACHGSVCVCLSWKCVCVCVCVWCGVCVCGVYGVVCVCV
jgi:hypothetical protein